MTEPYYGNIQKYALLMASLLDIGLKKAFLREKKHLIAGTQLSSILRTEKPLAFITIQAIFN